MFGIGGFELFIILIFGFLIFGPEKLPDIAMTIGKGIARFREAQADMNETIGNEKLFDPNNPDEPFKDPIEALDKLAARQEERRREKESSEKAKSGSKPAASSKTTTVKSEASKADSAKKAEKSEGAVEGPAGKPAAEGSVKEQEEMPQDKGVESGAAGEEPPARQESFTERKARYERERAARKAAEAEAAKADTESGAAEAAAADAASVADAAASESADTSSASDASGADADALAQTPPAEGGER